MNENEGLIDSFVQVREVLLLAADSVAPARRETPFVGHWNLMDLLAHLIGWDYTNMNAIEEFKAGRVPDFYREYDPGWAAYNQQLINRYAAGDWDGLRESLRQSQVAVVDMMRLLTPEEITREIAVAGRRRPVSIAGVLRAAIRDEREHLEQIMNFVDSQRAGGA
jgi:hypothetical protein